MTEFCLPRQTHDWEIWHNKGLCLAYLRKFDDAKEALMRANSIQRHDSTFMQLGQILTQEEDYKGAIETYLEALEFSPENPEMLTTIGLLYLRMGENFRAFDFLGNSLTHDATNAKTILAAGSIIQVRNLHLAWRRSTEYVCCAACHP